MRYAHHYATIAAICSLTLPAVAQGQAGNSLDPDSPAGVEYALPLEQARNNVADGDREKRTRRGGRGGAARVGALFGAGIVATKGSAGGGGGDGPGGEGTADEGSRSSGADGKGGDGASAPGGGEALGNSALTAPDSDDGSAGLQIAGIALAVLLGGALLGLLLRRGLRQSGA